MRVETICAKCGRELEHTLKAPFDGVQIYREKRNNETMLFIAPCYHCTDVQERVLDVLRVAYQSVEKDDGIR